MLPACLAAEDEEMTMESRKDENEEAPRLKRILSLFRIYSSKYLRESSLCFEKNFEALWRETYFKTIANENVISINQSVWWIKYIYIHILWNTASLLTK